MTQQYQLKFGGVDDHILFPSELILETGDSIEFEVSGFLNGGSNRYLVSGNTTQSSYLFMNPSERLWFSTDQEVSLDGVTLPPVATASFMPTDGLVHTLKLTALAQNAYTHIGCRYDLADFWDASIRSIKVTKSGVVTNYYQGSASSGTGSVLPDTVGSPNLTLVNFPVDDSQWITYGQYFTDFSEYSVGQSPADWVQILNANTLKIIVDAGARGNALQWTVQNFNQNRVLKWAALDGDTGSNNLEMLALCRETGSGNPLLVGRSNAGGTNFYSAGQNANGARVYSVVNGTLSGLGFQSANFESAWMWIRVSFVGSLLRVRNWADGSIEPSTWNLSVTNTNHSAAGAVGLFLAGTGDATELAQFGVGTGGDPAPASGLAPPPNTPINLGATNILATSFRSTWVQG
jgi:hypothetical protein